MIRTPRGVLRWLVPAVATVLVAWLALRWWSRPVPSPAPSPVVEIAGPPAWMAERAVLIREARERDGLIGRLRDEIEGRTAAEPKRVVVYDTLIRLVRDTMILASTVDPRGRLDVHAAVPADSGRHRPLAALEYDVSTCDRGVSIRGMDVLCRRAPFGHLTILGRVGLAAPLPLRADGPALPVAEIAARWTPAYRSRAALELAADRTGRVRITAEWGVRLF